MEAVEFIRSLALCEYADDGTEVPYPHNCSTDHDDLSQLSRRAP